MPAFSAGAPLTAAGLIRTLTLGLVKNFDESVNNSTALQGDDELNVPVAANVTYEVKAHILAIESVSATMDLKAAWTQPAGCILDLPVVGPHANWNGTAANLETEWNGWQNETGALTATRTFGTTNAAVLSYHFLGTLRVGANAGFLRLQWAQNLAVVGNLTVKAGSSLILTPVLA